MPSHKFTPASARALQRFQENERRTQRNSDSARKEFVRVNLDGSIEKAIVASSPARAAAKAFSGGGDSASFLIVELNTQDRRRGPGVHKYSVNFRDLSQREIENDTFLQRESLSGRIRQRKQPHRERLSEDDLKLGLRARDTAVSPAPEASESNDPEPALESTPLRRHNPFPSIM